VLLEYADRRTLPGQLERLAKRKGCVFTPGTTGLIDELARQLREFFRRERKVFDIPLCAEGTAFQKSVWDALLSIPAGTTRSYAAIASAVGRPTAIRAVARANGDNPIAILIPCHRVVGSDGSLTGYGGGVWRKQRLLELESSAHLVARVTAHQ
jgi:AraC family transcriptional regulator of adaptative response/methylated-DNA-[protein]-cysteine methyltransferase